MARLRPTETGAGLFILTLALSHCGGPRASPDSLCREVRLRVRRGELSEALALADRGCRSWQDRPGSSAFRQIRIAKAEAFLAMGNARDALALLARDLPAAGDLPELSARRLLTQGYGRFLLADYAGAKASLDEAFQAALASGVPGLVAEVELRRGAALTRLGQHADAEKSFRNALAIAGRERDAYLQAAALGNLGFSRLNRSSYDEAVPWFERALEASQQAGARKLLAVTLGNLGRCYFGLGDVEKAVGLLARAESLAGKLGDAYGQQIWLGDLGQAHTAQGEFSKAVSFYQQALAVSRTLGEDYSTLQWLNNLVMTSLDAGDLAAAEKYSRDALALARRVKVRDTRVWALVGAARVAAAHKDFKTAEANYRDAIASGTGLQAAWEARARLGDLYFETGRWREAETEFRTALSIIEGVRTRLARDEWKLSFQSGAIRFYRDYVELLMSRGREERALELAESCRARLLAEKLGLRGRAFEGASTARMRRLAARSGAVLISFWLAPRRSFAWIVQGRGIHAFVLPPEPVLRDLVGGYRGAIESLRDPLETGNAAGRRLYDVLIRPLAARVPRGSKVVIVADGCLNELSLESLPAGDRYWIEDVSVAMAPSLAMLTAPRRVGARPDSLLLIGNPVPPAKEFPPLPDVETEVQNIGRAFAGPGELVLTGTKAQPGAYRAAGPGRFTLIHFAAHATANPASPLESAVVLSRDDDGYKLYARDVVGIPLGARLVTISACRGAGARLYSGEGLVGFAWAFLEAGARNVIAGLWDVNDRSTALLMSRLYRRLKRERDPARALRAAKLALLKLPGPYRKPYYWAPFQVFTRTVGPE